MNKKDNTIRLRDHTGRVFGIKPNNELDMRFSYSKEILKRETVAKFMKVELPQQPATKGKAFRTKFFVKGHQKNTNKLFKLIGIYSIVLILALINANL